MLKQPMKIIIKGLGWSGSGAVGCLLQEFNGLVQVPGGALRVAPTGYKKLGEFDYFRIPGGIGDQLETAPPDGAYVSTVLSAYARRKERSARSKTIRGIISDRNVINAVSAVRTYTRIRRINRLAIRLEKQFQNHYTRSERIELAGSWMNEVADVVSDSETRGVIFDQAIRLGEHTASWPLVFQNWRLIIVHRDPRDQIVEQYLHGNICKKKDIDNRKNDDESFRTALKNRIDLTMKRMRAVDELMADSGLKENTMLIRFESLVNNYPEAVERIVDFLGLSSQDHARKGVFLDISWSKKNIGLHRNHQVPGLETAVIDDLLDWYRSHP